MATGTSHLDLVFAMDCTGSMASYIKNATDNIRLIVNEIASKEHVTVRLALIEFRDHPPQDTTFVTRVHKFTDSVTEAKGWLEGCSAKGGGDRPEAIADALNDALNLSWNHEAVKICILISDAPPHGLDPKGDTFPSGCPCGHDPLAIARKMAEKHIIMYTAGVEPLILPYRDFFSTLTHTTGGQYVPITDANRLAQLIIAAVREEISLDRLINNSRSDITREMRRATNERRDDNETARRLQQTFNSKKLSVNRMNTTAAEPSKQVEECYSKCLDMADIQKKYKKTEPAANTRTPETDYKLEEDQAITIGQSKRILQKAKNWERSAEEPTTRKTECNYGNKCHNHSSDHRAKFSHPERDDDFPRGHQPQTSDHVNSHTRSTNSRITDESTICKYGAQCVDHTDYHRTKYSHDENDNRPTQSNQQTRGDNFDTRSRETNSRFGNDDRSVQHNQQTRGDNFDTRSRETNSRFGNDDRPTQHNQQTRGDNFDTRSRENNSRFGNDDRSAQGNQQIRSNDDNIRGRQRNLQTVNDDHQCRDGKRCTNYEDYHRTKYSHPTS